MNSLKLTRTREGRDAMRRIGMNFADREFLNKWLWFKDQKPRGSLRKFARWVGCAPSTAHYRLSRLCDFGVLVKVGCTYVCFLASFVNSQLEVVRHKKMACPKSLKLKALSEIVRDLRTLVKDISLTGTDRATAAQQAKLGAGLTGKDAEEFWLRLMGEV